MWHLINDLNPDRRWTESNFYQQRKPFLWIFALNKHINIFYTHFLLKRKGCNLTAEVNVKYISTAWVCKSCHIPCLRKVCELWVDKKLKLPFLINTGCIVEVGGKPCTSLNVPAVLHWLNCIYLYIYLFYFWPFNLWASTSLSVYRS